MTYCLNEVDKLNFVHNILCPLPGSGSLPVGEESDNVCADTFCTMADSTFQFPESMHVDSDVGELRKRGVERNANKLDEWRDDGMSTLAPLPALYISKWLSIILLSFLINK